VRTSDALCRATSPRGAGSLPASRSARHPRGDGRAPCRTSSEDAIRRAPPRQGRWTRRRFRANGHRTNQSAFRRIDPDLAIRAGYAAFVVHSHDFTPHPVACREPGPPRQRMAGRFKLSCLHAPRPGLPRDVTMDARKMRLSDFCNRLQTRAPHRLPDSRVRAPRCSSPLRERSAASLRGPTLGQWPPVSPQVKLRLTANLQLQPCRNPSRSRALSGYPWEPTMGVMPRGPGGASIECSSALHLPTAALSTASRACDVASDALCRDPTRADPAFRSNLPGETARHRLRRRLVKDSCFADTRTPSLDECSLPCWTARAARARALLRDAACAAAPRRRIIDSPPPYSRLCRREPASVTLSPPERARGTMPGG
jgi:hypothetical protein